MQTVTDALAMIAKNISAEDFPLFEATHKLWDLCRARLENNPDDSTAALIESVAFIGFSSLELAVNQTTAKALTRINQRVIQLHSEVSVFIPIRRDKTIIQ